MNSVTYTSLYSVDNCCFPIWNQLFFHYPIYVHAGDDVLHSCFRCGRIILWELFCLKPLAQPKQTGGDKSEWWGPWLGAGRFFKHTRLFLRRRPGSSGLDSGTHHNGSRIKPMEFNERFPSEKKKHAVKCVGISGGHDVDDEL